MWQGIENDLWLWLLHHMYVLYYYNQILFTAMSDYLSDNTQNVTKFHPLNLAILQQFFDH